MNLDRRRALDLELERFKTEIKLPDFAASIGYEFDRKESTRSYLVMRRGGDKVAITLAERDSHWIYYSFRDQTDNGSIIDFVMKRESCGDFRGVCDYLRKRLGIDLSAHGKEWRKPAPVVRDRQKVFNEFLAARTTARHPFLFSRGISEATLRSPRFWGCVKIDHRGNAVFPHFDTEGICGLEKRNRDFWAYSQGGTRGLWCSQRKSTDLKVVVCESAIDSLSYYQLFDDGNTRYLSLGGGLSDEQINLLIRMLEKMDSNAVVVDATDNDEPGEEYSLALVNALPPGRVIIHKSESHKDWNDCVRF